MLAGRVALDGATTLLDVGGGSGAFTLAFCVRKPDLHATILDLPAVVAVAAEHREGPGSPSASRCSPPTPSATRGHRTRT